MQINTIKYGSILLLTLIFSCIEPYNIERKNFNELLVVEGMITNNQGPYTVNLSMTTFIDDPNKNPVNDALVTILDNYGVKETLTLSDSGTYVTDTFGIQGETGKKYKLRIELNDGRIYESSYSEIKEPVEILNLSQTLETKHDYILNSDIEGYRFYTEFQPYTDKKLYMLWLSEETYEYNASFTIDYLYYNYRLYETNDPDSLYTCWKTQNVTEITTFMNNPESNSDIIKLKLNHSELEKFAIKYSILVNQLSVDEETYNYFSAINNLNESQSSFYNQQPYQITGNIQNINDPEEIVIGYFFAAGNSQKRVFHVHHGVELSKCQPKDPRAFGFISRLPRSWWPIYVHKTEDGNYTHGKGFCFDCRYQGGKIEKPDFWE